jgi:hypothetical protein
VDDDGVEHVDVDAVDAVVAVAAGQRQAVTVVLCLVAVRL